MKKAILFLLLLFITPTLFAQSEKDESFMWSIYFGGGSYYIDQQQIQELHKWLDGFPGLEGYDILIHSHTDDIGTLDYNQWLSQMRTHAVIKILEQRGLRPETISKEDFGELNPVYDNATMEGKLKTAGRM